MALHNAHESLLLHGTIQEFFLEHDNSDRFFLIHDTLERFFLLHDTIDGFLLIPDTIERYFLLKRAPSSPLVPASDLPVSHLYDQTLDCSEDDLVLHQLLVVEGGPELVALLVVL